MVLRRRPAARGRRGDRLARPGLRGDWDGDPGVPAEALEFSWSSRDAPDSEVSFTLTDLPDGGTLLLLTHTVRSGDPASLMAAWHHVLADLRELLDTGGTTPEPGRFQRLRAKYAAVVQSHAR